MLVGDYACNLIMLTEIARPPILGITIPLAEIPDYIQRKKWSKHSISPSLLLDCGYNVISCLKLLTLTVPFPSWWTAKSSLFPICCFCHGILPQPHNVTKKTALDRVGTKGGESVRVQWGLVDWFWAHPLCCLEDSHYFHGGKCKIQWN